MKEFKLKKEVLEKLLGLKTSESYTKEEFVIDLDLKEQSQRIELRGKYVGRIFKFVCIWCISVFLFLIFNEFTFFYKQRGF